MPVDAVEDDIAHVARRQVRWPSGTADCIMPVACSIHCSVRSSDGSLRTPTFSRTAGSHIQRIHRFGVTRTQRDVVGFVDRALPQTP